MQTELFPRPTIHALYALESGDTAQMKAIGPTHVVVTWLHSQTNHRCIWTRADFNRHFHYVSGPPEIALPEPVRQPDLFGDLTEHTQ